MIYFKRLILAIFGKSLKYEQRPSKVHKIEYYDSAETYPFIRSQKFYKFLAQDAEIGDNPMDFFKHIELSAAYIKNNQPENANIELSNMRMAWFYTINEYSPIGAAAAISVKSIDGIPCDDTTTEGLAATLKKLSDIGFTVDDIRNKVEEIKKKSKWNWRFITRKLFTGKIQPTM